MNLSSFLIVLFSAFYFSQLSIAQNWCDLTNIQKDACTDFYEQKPSGQLKECPPAEQMTSCRVDYTQIKVKASHELCMPGVYSAFDKTIAELETSITNLIESSHSSRLYLEIPEQKDKTIYLIKKPFARFARYTIVKENADAALYKVCSTLSAQQPTLKCTPKEVCLPKCTEADLQTERVRLIPIMRTWRDCRIDNDTVLGITRHDQTPNGLYGVIGKINQSIDPCCPREQ